MVHSAAAHPSSRAGHLGGAIALALLVLAAFDVALTPISRAAGYVISGLEATAAAAVFLLTRRHFGARNFRRADAALTICAGLAIGIWAIILAGGISVHRFRVGALGFQSTWPVLLQVCAIGLLIGLCWFGDNCHDYAKMHGGIWRAVAITYQIASIALILYVLPILLNIGWISNIAMVFGLLGSIGMLTLIGAWIVHAIALILSGSRRQGAASA